MSRPDCAFTVSPRRLLLLQAIAAAAALSVALVAQFGFHLYPCALCLKQRLPYIAVIVLAVAAVLGVPSARGRAWMALLCTVLFFVDAGIALYHVGVESGMIESSCASHAAGSQTIEEMLAEIKGAPLVPCDQPMAKFMGLSMAAWNAMAASAMGLGSLAALLCLRRRARRENI